MVELSGLLEQLFECSLDAILLGRPDGTVLRANQAACRALGRSEAELRDAGRGDLVSDDEALRALLVRRETNSEASGELSLRRPDGTTFPAEVSSGILSGADGTSFSYAIFRDVSERRREAQALERANRALKLLTTCGEAIGRATDEHALLSSVCQSIVDLGGYLMCWVGMAGLDAWRTVTPVAFAGYEAGYLETIDVVWSDEPRGMGPTGRAIATGTPVRARYLSDDPALAPWRERALQRGYRATMAFPLTHDAERLGALTMYSSELEPCGEEELDILRRLSEDLAFGINRLRERQARRRAERALGERDELLSRAERLARLGSWSWTAPTRVIDYSEEACRLFRPRNRSNPFSRGLLRPHRRPAPARDGAVGEGVPGR